MIEDIIKEINDLRTKLNKSVFLIEKEIDYIIDNDIKSQQEIESILDILIDYSGFGIGKEQFVRLNSYYATFNQEYSDLYNNFYENIEK